MQIFVKLLHRRRTITLFVEASDTVGAVKAIILRSLGWALAASDTVLAWPAGSSMVTA